MRALTYIFASCYLVMQSVKVVIREARTGALVREGRASHPSGTECNPQEWWTALEGALAQAGGLEGVEAIAVAGQQHGMVALDTEGKVLRDALLWNDVRSADAAEALNQEVPNIHEVTGSRMVAAFTVAKARWLADEEPEKASKLGGLCLPHDWLSWKLLGGSAAYSDMSKLFTDRSDASGTGWFDPATSDYRRDILDIALRRRDRSAGTASSSQRKQTITLPRVLSGKQIGGSTPCGVKVACGAGDNAAAAFGLQLEEGDVVVSLGTSGTAFAVSPTPSRDASGSVAGFADVTGKFLPLVCTLNAARNLDAATKVLGCASFEELGQLALASSPGSGGLTMLPYFEGERTPNRPSATGLLHGITLANSNRNDMARAYVEGVVCGLADGLDALKQQWVPLKRVVLIGGAAKNEAVSTVASAIFGCEVLVPPAGEYVANGAARQAAWALLEADDAPPPQWQGTEYWGGDHKVVQSTPTPHVLAKYRELRDKTAGW
jgi:xylulokinase